MSAVNPAIPSPTLPAEDREVRDAPGPQALPREHPDLDFRLVEPASMRGSVVNGEGVPDVRAELDSVEIRQGLAAMDVQVVGSGSI